MRSAFINVRRETSIVRKRWRTAAVNSGRSTKSALSNAPTTLKMSSALSPLSTTNQQLNKDVTDIVATASLSQSWHLLSLRRRTKTTSGLAKTKMTTTIVLLSMVKILLRTILCQELSKTCIRKRRTPPRIKPSLNRKRKTQ